MGTSLGQSWVPGVNERSLLDLVSGQLLTLAGALCRWSPRQAYVCMANPNGLICYALKRLPASSWLGTLGGTQWEQQKGWPLGKERSAWLQGPTDKRGQVPRTQANEH